MFDWFRNARALLGMNARNLIFIAKANSRLAIARAGNKLETNRTLELAGIPTPKQFLVIKSLRELRRIDLTRLPSSAVIKPRKGFGGEGVLLLYGRNKGGKWILANRKEASINDLKTHIYSILSGAFSKSGNSDWALIEERLKIVPELKSLGSKGAPDVRVVVFNRVPVMAMIRLPTRESGGRSNLHQGGIGVGIDLGSGRTTSAVYRGQMIEHLPHSRRRLCGVTIPHWKKILTMAVKATDAIGLGFSGVDVIIDRERGPVVIEINARPGLSIQLANLAPLRERLERVRNLDVKSASQGVRLGQDLFGGDLESELEKISGRRLIGAIERVAAIDSQGQRHEFLAKIDTGAYRTSIDRQIAETLGLAGKVIHQSSVKSALGEEKREVVELELEVLGERIISKASLADRKDLKYDLILGRKDLRAFLIDPTKRRPSGSGMIESG